MIEIAQFQKWGGHVMKSVSLFFCLLILTACSDPNLSPSTVHIGSVDGILTSGNVRLITERARPVDGTKALPALCSEPSPDVAIAFAHSANATVSVTPTAGTTDTGSATGSLNETATQLEGRTAGVLALRDGLYAACQAYSNGVIGHDAYALILSQYGNLLVALVSGANTKATAAAYTAQDAAAAALLVACISEFDPTRAGAVSADGRPLRNPLLTSSAVCPTLLATIARGKPLHT
jgi:hypothetical protein